MCCGNISTKNDAAFAADLAFRAAILRWPGPHNEIGSSTAGTNETGRYQKVRKRVPRT